MLESASSEATKQQDQQHCLHSKAAEITCRYTAAAPTVSSSSSAIKYASKPPTSQPLDQLPSTWCHAQSSQIGLTNTPISLSSTAINPTPAKLAYLPVHRSSAGCLLFFISQQICFKAAHFTNRPALSRLWRCVTHTAATHA
jgi:hypothetical protein